MRVSLMAVVRFLDANLPLVEPSGGWGPAVNRASARLALTKPELQGQIATARRSAALGGLLQAMAGRISLPERFHGA